MAVNSITFGGVNSADFGIYISGEGVFNAPKRDVEMVSIPGRDGALALDKGRFENIEVTYPAFNFEPNDYESFAQNLSDFRNAICSLRGYQRLTDTFHPDEYRMATYIGGLEIKPIKYNTASEFSITFDCKPQRWLTSGETAVSVDDGDTLTNPTLFESSPLIEVEGYGTIGFNGYEIELEDAVLGEVVLLAQKTFSAKSPAYSFNTDELNTGDEITIGAIRLEMRIKETSFNSGATVTDSTSGFTSTCQLYNTHSTGRYYSIDTVLPSFTFAKGSTETKTNTVTFNGTYHDTNQSTVTCGITISANASGLNISRTFTTIEGTPIGTANSTSSGIGECTGYSTKSLLGHPTYIDCDLGEAYKYEGTSLISLNRFIDLGSDLPKLASGENEVTFDNTVTELTVTPRWWKI